MIFLQGTYDEIKEIAPTYINLKNPQYIEIDEMYYSSILITNYYREQTDLILKTIIDTNINLNISIFCEKQDTYRTIKDLTYHIGNVGVDLKTNNQNRQDIDIAAFTYNDAKYIRKELQVNNESLYFLYIYTYKIVNYISRNPRRTKRNINIICRYGRGNDFFNRLYIFSKISVVFFIGFFSCLPFSYHVAGQIFLRGFPAFIEALAPSFRVLINRAFQRTDNCLVVLSCY